MGNVEERSGAEGSFAGRKRRDENVRGLGRHARVTRLRTAIARVLQGGIPAAGDGVGRKGGVGIGAAILGADAAGVFSIPSPPGWGEGVQGEGGVRRTRNVGARIVVRAPLTPSLSRRERGIR